MKIYNLVFLLFFQLAFVRPVAMELPGSSPVVDGQPAPNRNKSGVVNLVFKSVDGGQSWQDISEGLPENLQGVVLEQDGFFANESGLYLRAEKEIYHSKANSTAPFWKREIFLDEQTSIAPGKTGIYAFNYDGPILQQENGAEVWSLRFSNFQEKELRCVFEAAEGSIFIGCDKGLFKSTNSGKSWKQVHAGGWVIKMAASKGVLMATSQSGIIRSTDGGESWDSVLYEGGVGIDIAPIQGGFAAITCNTASQTRRVRTSYDGGKSWQAIDAGLPPSLFISSIIQVGEDFLCGHPEGVFKSSDQGKTWQLILPTIENRIFNLSISGKVIYAVPRSGGC